MSADSNTDPKAAQKAAKKAEKKRKEAREVILHQFPKLLYAWPIIAFGLFFYPIAALFSEYPDVLKLMGWMYLFTIVMVIITIGVDLERNYAFVCLVVTALVIALMYIIQVQGLPVFGPLKGWLDSFNMEYNRGFGFCLSLILMIPYIVMIVLACIQDKWRITSNEFEHYSMFRADDSLARGAKRVRATYPDLLEFLLAGAGTLVIYNSTGQTVLRRINNVPFLFLKKKKIDQILETHRVTTEAALDDEVEEVGGGVDLDVGGGMDNEGTNTSEKL